MCVVGVQCLLVLLADNHARRRCDADVDADVDSEREVRSMGPLQRMKIKQVSPQGEWYTKYSIARWNSAALKRANIGASDSLICPPV